MTEKRYNKVMDGVAQLCCTSIVDNVLMHPLRRPRYWLDIYFPWRRLRALFPDARDHKQMLSRTLATELQ